MSRVRMPPPRAHLAGTLELLRRLKPLTADHPQRAALLAFLDRPADLPARVPPERATLKYDVYLACQDERHAWGVAVSDQYEGVGMEVPLRRFVQSLPGRYRLDEALALKATLAAADPSVVLAVAFDQPTAPPRLKLYLQERTWNTGLLTGAALAELLAPLGCAVPGWMHPRSIGVVTIGLLPDGRAQAKAYLGAASMPEAAAGAPASAQALAETMHRVSPLAGGWYYLTVRLTPGQPPRFAANKIYNPVQIGFTGQRTAALDAWRDVGALFEAAGNRAVLEEIFGVLAGGRLLVLPTATALEAGGRSTDVYMAAWSSKGAEHPTG